MAEVTIMVLRVDLACHKCSRKIKKLLCKYPGEIRDQTYIEKEDAVIIKVVCCSPETIRQKLICKGGKTIKSIEIRVPERKTKPPATENPKPTTDGADRQRKPDGQQTQTNPAAGKPNKGDPNQNVPAPVINPVTGYPPLYAHAVCCKLCLGPCHCNHGYAIPYQIRPPSFYDGWPSGCHCDRSYGCRCEYYTENYPPCTIM